MCVVRAIHENGEVEEVVGRLRSTLELKNSEGVSIWVNYMEHPIIRCGMDTVIEYDFTIGNGE